MGGSVTNQGTSLIAAIIENALNVVVSDQVDQILDFYASQIINSVIILSGAVRGSQQITLESGHGFVIGDFIEIWDDNTFFQAQVSVVNIDVIDILIPLNKDISNNSIINRVTVDMNIDASLNPEIFELKPQTPLLIHINRIFIFIRHKLATDDTKFGDLSELINGVILGHIKPQEPFDAYLFNAKTNGEFRERTFDLEYVDKSAGGDFAIMVRRSFGGQESNGVVIQVDGIREQSFRVIINDDLSALNEFRVIVQGHLSPRIDPNKL